GNDRSGFINGWFYSGRFSDSGAGDLHLATKFGMGSVAASVFTNLPTGDSKGGIATGNADFGAGVHWTGGAATASALYTIRRKRSKSDSNFPPLAPQKVEISNELRLEGGLHWPLSWWRTTNWVSEATGIFYNGGDFKPRSPIFLTTGFRHWFGTSGWALNA